MVKIFCFLDRRTPLPGAVVANYGSPPTDPSALKRICAAILRSSGQDKGIPPADVHALVSAMQKLGHSIDVKIYSRCQPRRREPHKKTGYRPADAADAHACMLAFFAQWLRARP